MWIGRCHNGDKNGEEQEIIFGSITEYNFLFLLELHFWVLI